MATESTTNSQTAPKATSSHSVLGALRTGMRLSQDIRDETGLLLLSAGTRVTPHFLNKLRARKLQVVRAPSLVTHQRSEEFRYEYVQKVEQWLAQSFSDRHPSPTARAQDRARLDDKDFDAETQRGLEMHASTQLELGQVLEDLCDHPDGAVQYIGGIVNEFVDMISLDFHLLPMVVGMQQAPDEYLFDHCMNVSLISMTIAAQLGLDRQQITEVGLGALLQDVGMLLVPESIRLAPRALTSRERFEIERHPIHTIDYLERIDNLPPAVRFIGYQVHERADGSGYPRHRSGMLIHQYAKIVAVADAYAAMTRLRPHRQPMLPYEAAKTVLIQGSRSKFDRSIVRALLDSVSLFPIGSWVRLNDGVTAKVIRSNPGRHTDPVVMPVDGDSRLTGVMIDLASEPGLRVVSAVETPDVCDQEQILSHDVPRPAEGLSPNHGLEH